MILVLDGDIEKALHKKFDHLRIDPKREWFSAKKELLLFVSARSSAQPRLASQGRVVGFVKDAPNIGVPYSRHKKILRKAYKEYVEQVVESGCVGEAISEIGPLPMKGRTVTVRDHRDRLNHARSRYTASLVILGAVADTAVSTSHSEVPCPTLQ